jgi:hypothetical protein
MPIKPNSIATRCFACLCGLTLVASCQTDNAKQQPTAFYDAVLTQIIFDHYYSGLGSAFEDTPFKRVLDQYDQGKMSDETLRQMLLYLKTERIKVAPKCTITFSPYLGLYEKHIVPEESKREMRATLFVDSEFIKSFHDTTAVDSLFIPSGLTAKDLHIEFMDVLPPQVDRHGRDWYQNYGGTLGISKPVFNSDHSRAILYQEYVYDGKNGKGMFVFVEKQKGEWKVYKYLVT